MPGGERNLVICLDGTWNKLDAPSPTNVVKLACAVADRDDQRHDQIVYYDEGVGTGSGAGDKIDRLFGGAFGLGLMDNVIEAYRFLIFNWRPGDRVFIFGFSRGAFTARSLVGLIRTCSILDRGDAKMIGQAIERYKARDPGANGADSEESLQVRYTNRPEVYVNQADLDWRKTHRPDAPEPQRLSVRYLGIWDTVGALGVPNHFRFAFLNGKKFRFHDHSLSSMVEHARHAVALDECRKTLAPALWKNLDKLNARAVKNTSPDDLPYQQQWFPGDHGSVGGGGDITGLSDLALEWVAAGAQQAGLRLKDDWRHDLQPDVRVSLRNVSKPGFSLLSLGSKAWRDGPNTPHQLSRAAIDRLKAAPQDLHEKTLYRPKSILTKLVKDTVGTPSGSSVSQSSTL